jgi:hypothetical protein
MAACQIPLFPAHEGKRFVKEGFGGALTPSSPLPQCIFTIKKIAIGNESQR